MIRTFLDAGVLIAASRGAVSEEAPAARVLREANRRFLASIFVYLEVTPKAIFHGRKLEELFYRTHSPRPNGAGTSKPSLTWPGRNRKAGD